MTKNYAQKEKFEREKIHSLEKSDTSVSRIKTGVKGFDELVEGGLPKNSFILLSGGTGTGKSIFGINFLVEGTEAGEAGLYVSLEEGFEENKNQMKLFGFDIDKLEKEKKLFILQPKMYNFEKMLESIQNAVYSIKAKRIVIDSISLFELYFEDKFQIRRSILDIAKMLKEMEVTTLAISEIDATSGNFSREGVEEFVADGVIVLYLDKKNNLLSRAISIRKMRSTNHSLKIHPVKIKRPGGFEVFPFEETFNEF